MVEKAKAKNEQTYQGYALKDSNGKVELPKNTGYALIFNQQEFDKIVADSNHYSQQPKTAIDFSTSFVFLLIHPSKIMSSLQFYDGLEATIEDENTIKLKPSFTELPYAQKENPIYNYGESSCQSAMYKIPKSKFKTIIVEWETGKTETIKMDK